MILKPVLSAEMKFLKDGFIAAKKGKNKFRVKIKKHHRRVFH